MDEDITIRAITIGVSIFITLATVTAVLTYYNTAKISVNSLGQGVELEENYRRDIETTLVKDIVNGSDLKNILIYFKDNHNVNVVLSKYTAFDNINGYKINLVINNGEKVNIVEKDNEKIKMFDNILKDIVPNQSYTLSKKDNRYEFKIK